MATLETQYKNYLRDNPDSTFTYDEWFSWFGNNISKALPKTEGEKVCNNCKYLLWMIALGQGLRCGHPNKTPKNYMIPSRWSTCEMFEPKRAKK